MKKIFVLFIFLPFLLEAQIEMPPASPDVLWSHQLGFTKIDMSYSRPQMRGRKIFGALVPYNEIWRTGAGESTRITFSEDIYFGDVMVPKGKYSIYSIPNPKEWTIILNSDATLHGDFGYEQSKDLLRIKIKPIRTQEKVESFSLDLTDFGTDFSAILQLKWEDIVIKIPLKSTADEKIMAQIEETIITKKTDNPGLLLKGAQYYFSQGKDLNLALEWVRKADKLSPGVFSHIFLTTLILEKLKRYDEAVKSAEQAIELAKKLNKQEEVISLTDKIDAWKKIMDP
jgi:tetratricopeptide (TPR) repeat protein